MRKISSLFLALFFITFFISCGGSSSLEDDFEEVNNNVVEKFLKRLEVKDLKYPNEKNTLIVSYDGNNRVSSVSMTDSYETSTAFFNYDSSGKLIFTSSGSSGDVLNVSELYQAP